MARGDDPLTTKTLATLKRLQVPHERVERPELERRWPQIDFGPVTWAIYEPESGLLEAFRGVQEVVRLAQDRGVEYLQAKVVPPEGRGGWTRSRRKPDGTSAPAPSCLPAGPGCRRSFPICSASGSSHAPGGLLLRPASGRRPLPLAADAGVGGLLEEIYGLPDFEGRGFKASLDRHGPAFDPDTARASSHPRRSPPSGSSSAGAFQVSRTRRSCRTKSASTRTRPTATS